MWWQVEHGEIDGVWHLGDLGYADDAFSHGLASFAYEAAYNGYMRWLEPIASRTAMRREPARLCACCPARAPTRPRLAPRQACHT